MERGDLRGGKLGLLFLPSLPEYVTGAVWNGYRWRLEARYCGLLEIAVGLPFQRVYQLGGDRQVADPGIVSAARSDFFTIGGIGAYDERVTAQSL